MGSTMLDVQSLACSCAPNVHGQAEAIGLQQSGKAVSIRVDRDDFGHLGV